MKKITLSLFLFICTLCFINFSIKTIDNLTNEICTLCEEIKYDAKNEDWISAQNNSTKLLELWNENYKIIILYVNTADLDTINSKVVELYEYCRLENKNNIIVSSEVLSYLILDINSLQNVNIRNIF